MKTICVVVLVSMKWFLFDSTEWKRKKELHKHLYALHTHHTHARTVIKNRRNKKELKWTEEIVRNRKKDADPFNFCLFACSFVHFFDHSFGRSSSFIQLDLFLCVVFSFLLCAVFVLNIKGWHKHLNTIIWMWNKNCCIRASGSSAVCSPQPIKYVYKLHTFNVEI